MSSYRVKKGDSLYAIAKKNNTTVAQLYKMNPALAKRKAEGKTVIFSNTVVRVPGSSSTSQSKSSSQTRSSTTRTKPSTARPATPRSSTKSSDTSGGISRQDVSSLRELNSRTNSRQARSDIESLASRLGLSKSDRSSLGLADTVKKKPKNRVSQNSRDYNALVQAIKDQGMW